MNTCLSWCSRGSQADIKNFLEESFLISLLVKLPASYPSRVFEISDQSGPGVTCWCSTSSLVFTQKCNLCVEFCAVSASLVKLWALTACLFIALSSLAPFWSFFKVWSEILQVSLSAIQGAGLTDATGHVQLACRHVPCGNKWGNVFNRNRLLIWRKKKSNKITAWVWVCGTS